MIPHTPRWAFGPTRGRATPRARPQSKPLNYSMAWSGRSFRASPCRLWFSKTECNNTAQQYGSQNGTAERRAFEAVPFRADPPPPRFPFRHMTRNKLYKTLRRRILFCSNNSGVISQVYELTVRFVLLLSKESAS